jgi:4-alpha-glucanotransferase
VRGRPSDSFSGDGQNWSFQTYDWDVMQADDYRWLSLRLHRMARLFQALCVDHILGFFRIWEVRRATMIRDLLDHFPPALPLMRTELADAYLHDLDRLTRPYVCWHLHAEKFGVDAAEVASRYFTRRGVDSVDDFFDFREGLGAERAIVKRFAEYEPDAARGARLQRGLFKLVANVILIPDEARPHHYHVHTEVATERVELTRDEPVQIQSSSFTELPPEQNAVVWRLSISRGAGQGST